MSVKRCHIVLLPWVAVVGLALSAVSCATDYSLTGQSASPTGSIIAVMYIAAGGGALGFCVERVVLVAKDALIDPSQIDKGVNYVFSASCGSKITLTWLSDAQLRISYTIDSLGGVSTYQRSNGFDGHVRLLYLPQS